MALPPFPWVFHFTPTSDPGSIAVETFFSALTRHRLRSAMLRSMDDLQAAINRYLKDHNDNFTAAFGG